MRANKSGTLFVKCRHAFGARGLAGIICDIKREEITRRNEAIHRVQVDVIGIHKVRRGPIQCLHCRIRLGTQILGLGADEGVLAVRLVPDRMQRHATLCGGLNCGELSLPLVSEAIAHADGESW